MSQTRLWKIYKTRVTLNYEFSNAWHTGPWYWDKLWNKYFSTNTGFPLWRKETPQQLETIVNELGTLAERTVFNWSWYGNAIILRNDLKKFCRMIAESTSPYENSNGYNRWSQIAWQLAWIDYNNKEKRLIGIGLGCTSVDDYWGYWTPKKGYWDVIANTKESL